MAKQGQQLSPLPTTQIKICGGQEKEQPMNHLYYIFIVKFPVLKQVDLLYFTINGSL